jgi:hypothetical protein
VRAQRSRDLWPSAVTLAPLFSSFRPENYPSVTMPKKNNNHILRSCYIRATGFEMNNPCSRCLSLSKSCVLSSESRSCSECVRSKQNCSLSSGSRSSPQDWKRVLRAHDKIESDRERILQDKVRLREELNLLEAKELRLQQQAKFLRKRGGRMLQEGIETLEELEALEAQEHAGPQSPVAESSCAAVETPIDFSGLGPEFWESLDFSGEKSELPVVPSSGP